MFSYANFLKRNEAVITQSFHKVKFQTRNFDAGILKAKSESFLKAVGTFKDYEIIYRGLSIEDM